MINVIGTILGCSGYDIHTRSLANALDKVTDVRGGMTDIKETQAPLTDYVCPTTLL